MSTSLPDIKNPKLTPEYMSQSTSLSFYVPSCPTGSTLKGLSVSFRYTISGEDMYWFAKIGMTNSDDLIYNPKVFGKPASGEVCIWLSYWPIGGLLNVGDEVTVSIVVMSGLEVVECGASLVYTDDDVAREVSENKVGWVETFGRDLSRFQLSVGSYYLCQRDFYKLMEVGRLTPGWLSILTGVTIDDTELRGWRIAGRPQQSYQSFTALKSRGFIIHGPETAVDEAEVKNSNSKSRSETPKSETNDQEGDVGKSSEFPAHSKSVSTQLHNQARVETSSNSAASSIPGRSRLRQYTDGDGSPVPRFHSWDVGNHPVSPEGYSRKFKVPRFGEPDSNYPASSDTFTDIFNKIREERHRDSPEMRTGIPDNIARRPQRKKIFGFLCLSEVSATSSHMISSAFSFSMSG